MVGFRVACGLVLWVFLCGLVVDLLGVVFWGACGFVVFGMLFVAFVAGLDLTVCDVLGRVIACRLLWVWICCFLLRVWLVYFWFDV